MNLTRAFLVAALAAGMTILIGPGCGSSASSECKKSCDCIGCNDSDLKNCQAKADGAEKCADDLGCGSFASDYLSCLDDNAVCVPGKGFTAGNACDAQFDKLHNGAHGCDF